MKVQLARSLSVSLDHQQVGSEPSRQVGTRIIPESGFVSGSAETVVDSGVGSIKKHFSRKKIADVDRSVSEMAKALWQDKRDFNEEYERMTAVGNGIARRQSTAVNGEDDSGRCALECDEVGAAMSASRGKPSSLTSGDENEASSGDGLTSDAEHSERTSSITRKKKIKKKKKKKRSICGESRYSLNHVRSSGGSPLPAVRMAPRAIQMGTEDKIYEYNVLY